MCGAIVTSPFDVVKTRLQSDLFREKHTSFSVVGAAEGVSGSAVLMPRRPGGLLYNFVETGHILRYLPVCTSCDNTCLTEHYRINITEISIKMSPRGLYSRVLAQHWSG